MSNIMTQGRLRWFVIAFLVAGIASMGILVWQLAELTPAKWCAVAKIGSPELASGCYNVLLELLKGKTQVTLGLLALVALSQLGLAAIALGLRFNLAGPGGLTADIGPAQTTVSDGDSTVTIPTPPAAG